MWLTGRLTPDFLDEANAPLDDANVERFCDLLEIMYGKTETRFLTVTHNPIEMALEWANRLVRVDGAGSNSQYISITFVLLTWTISYFDFFVYKFWRCVDVEKAAGEYVQTFIEFRQANGRELQHGGREEADRGGPEKFLQPVRRSLAPDHHPTVVAAPDKPPD